MAAITLEAVGKRYRQTLDTPTLLHQLRHSLRRREHVRQLWALRDLDLEILPGETVGIIGRNGAGKTSLLRLLAGVSAPTTGRVRVEGCVSPLIGVGVGFHPELTGRENVFANGQILGMTKKDLERDFDEIVAFSELEDFVDVPVKFYSSGMFLRLAYSVAVHRKPDVFLVDEVLAVGDFAFQLKCFDRMDELRAGGSTIVVVTHNLGLVRRMCERVLVLSQGAKVFDGDVEQGLGVYHELMSVDARAGGEIAAPGTDPDGDGQPVLSSAKVSLEVLDESGVAVGQVDAGTPVVLRVRATFTEDVRSPGIGLAIHMGPYGVYMGHSLPGEYDGDHGPGRPLEVRIPLSTPVLEGSYRVDVSVVDERGEQILGRSAPATFYVSSPSRAFGVADLGASLVVDGRVVSRFERIGPLGRDGPPSNSE